jgi:atypical dual specificity phosphatase
MYPKFQGKFVYKTVIIDDVPSANIKQYFAVCHRFIESAHASGGVVLVHCWAGVSRSATIVISFLMQKYGITMMQAMDHVRLQRWFINPNPGFKNQMKRFEKELLSGPPQNAGQKDAEESK